MHLRRRPDPTSSLGIVVPKWVKLKGWGPSFWMRLDALRLQLGCALGEVVVHRERVRRRRLWERLQRRQSRLTRFASHHHHSARAILRFCKIAQLWGGGAFRTPPSALWNCGRSWGTRSTSAVAAGSTYVCANFCHPAAVAFEKCILNGSSCPENRTESELRGRRRGRGHRCAAKGGGTILITCQSGPAWTLSNNFASTPCSAANSAVNSLSCADTLWDQYYPGLGPGRVRSKVGFHGLSLQFWNFRIRIFAFLKPVVSFFIEVRSYIFFSWFWNIFRPLRK